jgi:glycine/serine hydroxymethyltransferase
MHGQKHSFWSLFKRGFKTHPTWERAALQPVSDDADHTLTSGIHVGTAAGTKRGFGVAEFEAVGGLLLEVFMRLKTHSSGDAAVEASV